MKKTKAEETEMNTATEPATELTPEELVVQALTTADPDADPVTIRAAWRDLGCSGSGPEAYRRVRYPGSTTDEWPDSERLPAQGGARAAERRATTYCEVPPGTIVITYEREVYRGRRGRCSVEIGVAYRRLDGKGGVLAVPHRTLRSRRVYAATLPTGAVIEIERRE